MAEEEEKKEEQEEALAREEEGTSEYLEHIIKEFANENVIEQRSSLNDFLKEFNTLTSQLGLTSQLKCRIQFLLSIKFEVFFRFDTNNADYTNTNYRFYSLVRYLLEKDIVNKIQNISNDEKRYAAEKIDDLLSHLNINLIVNVDIEEAARESLGKIKILIEELKGYMAFIVGIAKGRGIEKKIIIASDLEDQAEFFEIRANRYSITAARFLYVAGIFIAVIALPTICNLIYNLICKFYNLIYKICTLNFCDPRAKLKPVDLTEGDYLYFYIALNSLLSSSTLLSIVMLVGLFACISFYAASKHNAIVCEQRASILNSYQALRYASEGEAERLLVLEKVLDSATSHQPTGFSKEGSGVSGGVVTRIVSGLASILTRSGTK